MVTLRQGTGTPGDNHYVFLRESQQHAWAYVIPSSQGLLTRLDFTGSLGKEKSHVTTDRQGGAFQTFTYTQTTWGHGSNAGSDSVSLREPVAL